MMYSLIVEDRNGLGVRPLCELAQVSRSGDYRVLRAGEPEPDPGEMDPRDQIQQICLEMPGYGYRRVTKALQRLSYPVNHKRVLRLMRQDNLLCLRSIQWLRTTHSAHGLPVYPNLARQIEPEAPNQLWVADITYIRLLREFIYLAVILDAFSRRVLGWALSRHLDTTLSLTALQMALNSRLIQPGLVHHSDQGVQYAAQEYIAVLRDHQITISMGRKGNPYDNAFAESFIKTLKYEEVLLKEYEHLPEAYANIAHFIEEVYNRKRLHSALGYRPPVEFEELFERGERPKTGITFSPC